MLKDITLGQYFPADTVVHRLDPRTKLLAVILYIVALFTARGAVTYAISAALLAASVLLSHVPFKSLTRGLQTVYHRVRREILAQGDVLQHTPSPPFSASS